MRFQLFLTVFWLAVSATSKLLVDYNAERGDDVSIMGQMNLEQARNHTIKSNTGDLYIKTDKDWLGSKAAHFHRKKGYIRAEMHALAKKMKAGETYYLTYSFALGATPNSLMVWQWKEYDANKADGANISLSLAIKSNQIFLAYQADNESKRVTQWTTDVKPNTVYNIGLEILAKSSGGHVKLYWNGERVTFSTNGKKTLTGNMFPGRSEPKVGIYRGEDVETDGFVYKFQVGTEQADVDAKYF